MIEMMLVGAAIGSTLFAIAWRLMPRRVSPLVQLARFDAREAALASHSVTPSSDGRPAFTGGLWTWDRAGHLLAVELERRGFVYVSLRQDLALTGRSLEWALGRKVMAFVAGFVLVAATATVIGLGTGWRVEAGGPFLMALFVGTAFSFLPDLEARYEALQRRVDFRRALAAWLDLVALEMAGSAAPAEALPSAARVGAGWAMALLRDTLWRATLAGRDHWEALTELGERIGVNELRDLGTLVRLVGRDGAQVRQTLSARAATMRRAELAEAEGRAGKRDQSMLLAQILIGFGFLIFITYPAVMAVMTL